MSCYSAYVIRAVPGDPAPGCGHITAPAAQIKRCKYPAVEASSRGRPSERSSGVHARCVLLEYTAQLPQQSQPLTPVLLTPRFFWRHIRGLRW